MKKLRFFFLFVLVAVGTTLSASSCSVFSKVPVVQCNPIYEYKTEAIPYKVCKDVCVPVKNACNCTVGYKHVKSCVTKYKYVTKKIFKGYENVGYWHGQKVVKVWPTKLCTIPIEIRGSCCVVLK